MSGGISESGRHGKFITGTVQYMFFFFFASRFAQLRAVGVGTIIACVRMGMWGSIVSYRIRIVLATLLSHILVVSYRIGRHDPSFASVVKRKGERKGTDTYMYSKLVHVTASVTVSYCVASARSLPAVPGVDRGPRYAML